MSYLTCADGKAPLLSLSLHHYQCRKNHSRRHATTLSDGDGEKLRDRELGDGECTCGDGDGDGGIIR